MKFSYEWLQKYFEEPLPDKDELYRVIGLQAFEPEGREDIDGDTILDFDILPNRAHDCLCHLGLAQEISALFDLPLKTNPAKPEAKTQVTIAATITEQDRCRRYMTRVIEGVTVKPSPTWLKNHLERIGQRSINNIVDATNYVMFDLGQPLHAFDKDKISGHIEVRLASEGELIDLLGGEERILSGEHLVIADEAGPLAIAGIKGGSRAQVDEHTKNIVLEAANFEPVSTRKTSRELKLQTDSSKRFENEITPKKAAEALEAVTRLILEITAEGAAAGPISDTYPNPKDSPRIISLQTQDVNKTLGLGLTRQEISLICSKLRLKDAGGKDQLLELTIPSDRLDLEISEDIIEEVGRVYGYDNIPTVLPSTPEVAIHPRTLLEHQIRDILLKDGWNEVMTYTFTNAGDVEMANALASDKNFLRTNLATGFTESLEKNIKNAELFGADSISQFEIGSVFSKNSQEVHLALGYRSNKKKDKKDLVAVLENINAALGLDLQATEKDGVLEVCLPKNPATTGSYQQAGITNSKDDRDFSQPSAYPFITRDVAVWLPEEVSPENLTSLFTKHGGELLVREPRLFDMFTKEGRTSYAYRLVFQAADRTLTDSEIGEIMQTISQDIASQGWEER